MTLPWVGSISIDSGQHLKDISIKASNDGQVQIPADASLRFLSIVDTARIPLFLSVGRPSRVTTSEGETERWLSSILLGGLQNESDSGPWRQSARTDSPLAILVAVDYAQPSVKLDSSSSKPTELLLYASRHPISEPGRPPTPPQSSPAPGDCRTEPAYEFQILAQPLRSDLLQRTALKQPTPPASPHRDDEDIEATFLPQYQAPAAADEEFINLPPVRKRKSLNETFDEAGERRRQARRKGGEGVSAAAASRTYSEDALPTLKHRRSISNAQRVPLQSRPLSRASSAASGRLTDAREASVPAVTKQSSLARVQSTAGALAAEPEEPTIDQKNKEIISKTVMAGMRLYGLVQSKNRKSRANSAAPSPALDTSFNDLESERQKDEEYKLVYHQVYKGTCFAFRAHITIKSLQPHTEALRKAVDELLAIFCGDPLAVEMGGIDEDYTPGGRKAFGSSVFAASEKQNPFLAAQKAAPDSKANTPCARKPSEREKEPAR